MNDRFWSKVDRTGGDEACWPWLAYRDPGGYGRFGKGGRGAGMVLAHRYALGVTDPNSQVLHSCDNPSCVNPRHLRVGDHSKNMRDMAARERSRTTKLSATQVLEIRAAVAGGGSHARVARQYGISKSNVQAIASRATWRHLQ